MNERIKELAEQAKAYSDQQWLEAGYPNWEIYSKYYTKDYNEKFAELIVEECRNVVTEVYRNTPLELCGPLLTADEEIAKHFYGVEE
jgi:hypothetical protein